MSAVVLFSGGVDSTVCLAWAVERWGAKNVTAMSVKYGQRNAVELERARNITSHLDVENVACAVTFPFSSGLITGIPPYFHPARNAVFLSIAAGLAKDRRAGHIVAGFRGGYPDTGLVFTKLMQAALTVASAARVKIEVPLLYKSAAAVVRVATQLGALGLLKDAVSCYTGFPACGRCPACVLRARGFAEAGVPDPAQGAA